MSKIAILNDLHVGFSGAAQLFQNELKTFFDDVFFPWVDENDVGAVVVAGDLFDNRRDINIKAANEIARAAFLDRLEAKGVDVHIILGNHDVYYRNRLTPNSVSQLADEYDRVRVYDAPTEVEVAGVPFLMLPWICEDNAEESATAIERSKSRYCAAHLELVGFEMESNQVSKKGGDAEDFKHFDLVFTGHYHSRSRKDNVLYMGTQYQMTRADDGQVKGFHHLDSETFKVERVVNPRQLFRTIRVESDSIEGTDAAEWFAENEAELKGRILTVIFDDECSEEVAEAICTVLETSSVYDYKIVDSLSRAVESGNFDEAIEVEDTLSLIKSHVEKSESLKDLNREVLTKIFTEVHSETLNGSHDD